MPQYSIDSAPAIGYAGQIAEPGAVLYSASKRTEGATCVAGMPVKRGTDSEVQVEPFEAGDEANASNFAGFIVLETSRALNSPMLADKASVAVMRCGVLYLNFAGAATAGHGVKLTLADGTLESHAPGAAVGAGKILLPGVLVSQTTSGAGVARVEIMLLGGGAVGSSDGLGSRMVVGPFTAPGAAGVIAASQTNLDMRHSHTVTAMAAGYVATRPGSIVGLSAQLSAAITGATSVLAVKVTVNGTEVGSGLDLSLTQAGAEVKDFATAARGLVQFAAGDVLGVSYTSDANLSNTPALVAELEISQ